MLFNSIHFALFFPVVTMLYFAVPHRARGPLLLAASCYFYMAFIPKYILILLLTISIDYVAGLIIAGKQGVAKRFWLAASIIANIGVLAFFKYFNFINDSFRALAGVLHVADPISNLSILLPIGLSFHTFQSMSYTIEVYRGEQPPERNIARFALYVLFYPQLVAGPIERPQNLLHQLRTRHYFDYDRVRSGLQLMAWGLFKKVAVADQLAAIVNPIYANPHAYSGTAILGATYCFAIQIYADFSGYSDIAIGAAQVMGFRLMRNFDHPYFSRSISEFWRRWHISLSTWFRDYLYIPMGGSRVSTIRKCLNLLVTFAVSGLWHGANWTFVIWGCLNGFYLVFAMITAPWRSRLLRLFGIGDNSLLLHIVRVGVTFHLILLSWFFFRASTLSDACYMIWAAVTAAPGQPMLFPEARLIPAATLVAFLGVEYLQSRIKIRNFIAGQPTMLRWAVYATCLIGLSLLADFSTPKQFIYFQF